MLDIALLKDRGVKNIFLKFRGILEFHVTLTAQQPKGRCVWCLEPRSRSLGSCFAEKLVRQFVPPISWDFFTDLGRGGGGVHAILCGRLECSVHAMEPLAASAEYAPMVCCGLCGCAHPSDGVLSYHANIYILAQMFNSQHKVCKTAKTID